MKYTNYLLTVLALSMSPAWADTVWLKNGDRLSGTIKVLDDKHLLLDTEYGGRLIIDRRKIKTLRSEQQLLVKTREGTQLEGTLEASKTGAITLEHARQTHALALADIEQVQKPKPLVSDLIWDGNVDVALNYKNGESDSQNYALDLNTKARHDRWRHNADAKYRREFKDAVRTTDNWGAEYALDHFIDQRWFWQNRLSYKRDRVEEVREQKSFGTGPGFQFWDDELGAFSVASLLNRSDLSYDTEESEHFYALGLKWDYRRYLLSRDMQLFATGELGKPLSAVADYSFSTALGLRYKLTDWASLNLRGEKELVSGEKGQLNETRYSIGIGVGW